MALLLLPTVALLAQSGPSLPPDVIIEQATIPMRDGFKLEAEVYRFADSDGGSGGVRYPVSTLLTMYDLDYHRIQYHRYFLAAGQIYVGVHMRDACSRGAGDPAFQFGTYENAYQLTRDAYDVAEWISRQPWCNGNVGFKGASGNAVGGSAAIWADHPAIKAVSISHSSSNFHDYWLFLNGIKRDTFDLVRNRGVNPTARVWPRPDTACPDTAEWKKWIGRRARETHVAYYESAGIYDIFEEAAVDNFAALAPYGKAHVNMEPRWHGAAATRLDGLAGTYSVYTGRQAFAATYDGYLNGTASSDASLHNVAVLGPSSSRYVAATQWPVASTPLDYFLHSDGSLQTSPSTSPDASLSYVHDPKNPAPNAGGNSFASGYGADLTPLANGYNYGPLNQNIPALTSRADILRFVSSPLAQETTIVGNVEVDLRVSTTAEDTMFVVKLVAINPANDFHALVKDGAFLARYHSGAAAGGSRLAPGQIVSLPFKLWTTAVTLPAGWRLAVHVSSAAASAAKGDASNYLEVHPNTFDPCPDVNSAPVATNTVHLSQPQPSRVRLPIVALGPSDTTFPLPPAAGPATPPFPGALAVRGEGEDFIPNGDTAPSVGEWTDFEEVRKNRTRTRRFILHNTAASDLSLGRPVVSGAAEFTIVDAPSTVPPHGTAEVRIRYSPAAAGSHTATVTLAPGLPHGFSFDVTGHCVNYSPVLNAEWDAARVTTGESASLTPPAGLFYDPDGDSFTFSMRSAGGGAAPGWASIDPATGEVTTTAPIGAEGTYNLEIVATEAGGGGAVLVAPLTLQAEEPAYPWWLHATATSNSAVQLTWPDLAPAETAYEVQRRSMNTASVVVVDAGEAGYTSTGPWTSSTTGAGFYGAGYLHDGVAGKGGASVVVEPGLAWTCEVAAWVVPTRDADSRVPVQIEHSGGTASFTLNQSTIAPANAWDFREADSGVNIQHASVLNTGSQFDPATSQSKWSYSSLINTSVTTGGHLRLRPIAGTGTSTFSGYSSTTNNLGYTTDLWVLEVDLGGWNVVGTANDQWFQLGFMNDNGTIITCGLVLQQNASGLALWGRALGSGGTMIGGVSAPIKQYPASQTTPVTLRLEADFTANTYRIFYRDSGTNGGFVEAATTGNIDPAFRGRALRLNMVQDWSQSGEYLDLTRIRTYQPVIDPGAGSWVALGTHNLDSSSRVTLGNSGTIGLVRADAIRFVPLGVGAWTPIASLPANSTAHADSGLTPGGAYEYRVRAVAGAVTGRWSPTSSVTLPGGDPYAAWADTIGWNGSDSAPDAELPGNGLPNFLIFGLGGDPVAPGGKSHLLPSAVIIGEAGNPELRFSFLRAQSTLTYIVESSQTLADDDWVEEFRNPGTPGGPVTVSVPMDGAGRKFLRLRIAVE